MSAQLAVLESAALIRSGANWNSIEKEFRFDYLSDYQIRQFRLVYKVSQESGGSLVAALERLARVFEQQQKQQAEINLAFATPKATANLILGLPLLALILAELFGIGVFSAVINSSLGIVSLAAGLILLIIARIVSLRMLLRARPLEQDPGAIFDAIAIGLSAGLGPKSAVGLANRHLVEQFGLSISQAELTELDRVMALSERLGMSVGPALAATADVNRYRFWQAQKESTSKLTISLLVPLGLIALPAFLLLAVVPVAIGLFQGS